MIWLGIVNDWNYIRYVFWRSAMRACAKTHVLVLRAYRRADNALVRAHQACHIRAARLDRRRGE